MTSNVDAILKQLAGEFLVSCEENLVIIDDSVTRLMGADADWDKDFAEILRYTHSIKGSGGTFGFPASPILPMRWKIISKPQARSALTIYPPHRPMSMPSTRSSTIAKIQTTRKQPRSCAPCRSVAPSPWTPSHLTRPHATSAFTGHAEGPATPDYRRRACLLRVPGQPCVNRYPGHRNSYRQPAGHFRSQPLQRRHDRGRTGPRIQGHR